MSMIIQLCAFIVAVRSNFIQVCNQTRHTMQASTDYFKVNAQFLFWTLAQKYCNTWYGKRLFNVHNDHYDAMANDSYESV